MYRASNSNLVEVVVDYLDRSKIHCKVGLDKIVKDCLDSSNSKNLSLHSLEDNKVKDYLDSNQEDLDRAKDSVFNKHSRAKKGLDSNL